MSNNKSWLHKRTKHLSFYGYITNKRKTPIYQVRPTRNDFDFLGEIKYYPGWRKFVFTPNANTQFDDECLNDIADFIKNDAMKYNKEEENE